MTMAPDRPLPAEERLPLLLVVDDQPINIQALYQALQSVGQVLMATAGEQALKLAAARQPEVVLLDVVMPGMDGFEVCRRLRADAATRDIAVIFVTGHNDEASETLGLSLGAADFISKPFNPALVRARVNSQLTLRRQAALLRQLGHSSPVDALTGVRNRRCFDEHLAIEWARALRNGSEMSVVLVDLDGFRVFNQRQGAAAGDEALRRVAAVLQAGLKRPGDLLARYSGDQFVCLLPETPLEGAMALARQLRADVAALGIAHEDAAAGVLTVSLGVCTKPGDAVGTVALLLREAGAQLHIAKAGGRNRACSAELAVA